MRKCLLFSILSFLSVAIILSCKGKIREEYSTTYGIIISKEKTKDMNAFIKKVYCDNDLKIEVNYLNEYNKKTKNRQQILININYYFLSNENKFEIREQLIKEYGTPSFGLSFIKKQVKDDMAIYYVNSNIDDDKEGLEYDLIKVENNKKQVIYLEEHYIDYWVEGKAVIDHKDIIKRKYDEKGKVILLESRFSYDNDTIAHYSVNEIDASGNVIVKNSDEFYKNNYFKRNEFDEMKKKFFPNEDIEYYRKKNLY